MVCSSSSTGKPIRYWLRLESAQATQKNQCRMNWRPQAISCTLEKLIQCELEFLNPHISLLENQFSSGFWVPEFTRATPRKSTQNLKLHIPPQENQFCLDLIQGVHASHQWKINSVWSGVLKSTHAPPGKSTHNELEFRSTQIATPKGSITHGTSGRSINPIFHSSDHVKPAYYKKSYFIVHQGKSVSSVKWEGGSVFLATINHSCTLHMLAIIPFSTAPAADPKTPNLCPQHHFCEICKTTLQKKTMNLRGWKWRRKCVFNTKRGGGVVWGDC